VHFVQVFFVAVDKAWKTKVSNIIRHQGPQSGLLTQNIGLPSLQVAVIILTAHH